MFEREVRLAMETLDLMNTIFSIVASIVSVTIALPSIVKGARSLLSKSVYWDVGQGRVGKADVGGPDGESCLNDLAAQMKDRVQFEKMVNTVLPKTPSGPLVFLVVLLVCLIVGIVFAWLFGALPEDSYFRFPVLTVWVVVLILLITVCCIFLKYEIVSMVGPWWLKRYDACKVVNAITLQNIRRIACYESVTICFIEAIACEDMSRRSINSLCDCVSPVSVNKVMAAAVRNNKMLELNENEVLPGSLSKSVLYVVISIDGTASRYLSAILMRFGYTAYDFGAYFDSENLLRAEIHRLHMYANAGLLPCEFVEYVS